MKKLKISTRIYICIGILFAYFCVAQLFNYTNIRRLYQSAVTAGEAAGISEEQKRLVEETYQMAEFEDIAGTVIMVIITIIVLFVMRRNILNPLRKAIEDLALRIKNNNSETKNEMDILTSGILSLLDSLENTISKVKNASNDVVEGVAVVRDLADDNRQAVIGVVEDMNKLSADVIALKERTDSSVSNTNQVNGLVDNVADMVNEMVVLSGESAVHAKESTDRLNRVVKATKTVEGISGEVNRLLQLFANDFSMVKKQTAKIEDINNQTNLLSLNASIEAARAGDAGLGFAVVAQEISALSDETRSSSESIRKALESLDATASKMSESVGSTLELMAEAARSVMEVVESISLISRDSERLGDNVQIIDNAIREVRNANHQLVKNIGEISETMDNVVNKTVKTSGVSEQMVEACEETSAQVINIEQTVGDLMTELGAGGFMSVDDIKPGMMLKLLAVGKDGTLSTEMSGKVIKVQDDTITMELMTPLNVGRVGSLLLRVTVNNVIYQWEQISFNRINGNVCDIAVNGEPTVINRRKYPRLNLNTLCKLTVKDKEVEGNLINVSAGGFAVRLADTDFSDLKGQLVRMITDGLPFLNKEELAGCVVRISKKNDFTVIGCRLLDDNEIIEEYIKKGMKEEGNKT